MRVLLREVKVKCFRFFCGENVFRFKDGITIVAGPVGVGKSSLLDAIEYGVFGTCFGIRRRMYSKLDLLHSGCSDAEVEITLEAEGEGTYRVVRRLSEKGVEEVTLYDPNGEVFIKRSVVNEILRELLGLDVSEFERTVYLNQVFLYNISYGTPALKSRVIDGLLGIEALEKIAALVARYARLVEERVKAVDEELYEVESEVERLKSEELEAASEVDKLLSQIEAKRELLEEEKKRLVEVTRELKELKKVVEEYYRLQGLREYLREQLGEPPPSKDELLVEFEKARLRLRDIARDLLLEDYLKEIEELSESKKTLHENVKKLREILDKVWDVYNKRLESLRELSIERERRRMILSQLEKRLVEMDPIVREYEDLERELELMRKEFGDEKSIRRRLSDLELKYKVLESAQFERKCVKMLRNKIKKTIIKNGVAECPVCGAQVRNLPELTYRSETAEEGEKILREISRLKEVLDRINDIKVKLVEYEDLVSQYRELMDKREKLLSEIDSLSSQIEQVEIRYKEIGGRLAAIERDVDFIEEALRKFELGKKLGEVEERLDLLGDKYSRYVLLQDKEEKLRKNIETLSKEISELEEKLGEKCYIEEELNLMEERLEELRRTRDKYVRLSNTLSQIAGVYRAVQREIRREMVEKVSDNLKIILKSIYPYEDIEDVRLVVEEKRGKSIYNLEVKIGGEWSSFSSRLSEGQKMIVILALLAAFFKSVKHNAGFLLLDEPVPNVDVGVKKNVFKGLSETLKLRQVVFTTQAVDVAKNLEGVEVIEMKRGVSCGGRGSG